KAAPTPSTTALPVAAAPPAAPPEAAAVKPGVSLEELADPAHADAALATIAKAGTREVVALLKTLGFGGDLPPGVEAARVLAVERKSANLDADPDVEAVIHVAVAAAPDEGFD